MTYPISNWKNTRKTQMTSRERLLAAIKRQEVDYVPCSPGFNYLRPPQRVGYQWQLPFGDSTGVDQIEYLVKNLGVDPVVNINISAGAASPEVTHQVWLDQNILHKVIHTLSGDLHAAAKYDEKWPFGMDIPLGSDWVGHYVEFWIKTANDVKALSHLLQVVDKKERIESIRNHVKQAQTKAETYQLATCATIGMGLTWALQMFGPEQICLFVLDQPELVHEFLELEHRCNVRAMEIAVDLGIDIIRRNGFYESCDFYSPAILEQFLGPRLRKEIETVHQGGKVIGYTLHTGVMPMLDYLDTLDFDSIMHLDIAFKDHDIQAIRAKLGKKKSFWTGPSSTYHLWSQDPEVVRQAVRDVFRVFGKTGLVLTACPSVHSIMPWENTLAMVDEWKRLR